jgi:cytochrome c-type biogenesis protein CcmH/NrfG
MSSLRDTFGLLLLRDESLRSAPARGSPVLALAVFLAGFAAFALVRGAVYAELQEPQGAPAPLGYVFSLNVVPALVYFALIVVPLLISLSNALAGDGLGFTVSRREYRAWLMVLPPLWGLLFLVTAPVQWLLPQFLVLGEFGISIGLLVLSSLMIFYTNWAAGRLAGVPPPVAAAVVVICCLTLPALHLLAARPYIALLILIAAAMVYCWSRLRARAVGDRVERTLEQRIASLEVKLQDAEAQHRTGMMQLQLGRLGAAAVSLGRAAQMRPDLPEYHYDLGRVFEAQGDWPAALERYETARGLASDWHHGNVLREAAKGYLHAGATDKAAEMLRSYLNEHGSDPEARYWLAVALGEADCPEEMIVQLHTLLEQARSNPRQSRRESREWVLRARALLRGNSA